MKKICLMAVPALVAVTAGAAEMKHGSWRLSIGPAWRERVKSSISGTADVTPIAASYSVNYDQNIATHGPWTGAEPNIVTVTDPLTSLPTYAATATRTETMVSPNGGVGAFSSSDERSPLGMKASVGFDFYDNGVFSVGVDVRFAAYWDMKSSARGSAGGGMTTDSSFTDYYLFDSGPYPVTPAGPGWAFFFPSTAPELALRTPSGSTTTAVSSAPMSARITSDLYQIGLGPFFSWHVCEWLDAYAKAAALCNIAHMDADVNYSSSSHTICRFGVGGEIGAVAWVTDNLGVYTEVGYEWIDEASVRTGDAKATSDFSSLMVGAGVVVGF